MKGRRVLLSRGQMLLAVALALVAAVVVCSTSPAPAFAATLTVTKAADTDDGVCDGDCSLREALAVAANGDTITFAGDYVIYLNSTLNITKTLTVDGSGHAVTVSGDTGGDGTRNVRAFEIGASGVVTLSHLSIVSGTAGSGGGIENYGTLLVQNGTLSGNSGALYDGGICNYGTLRLHNTLVTNSANGDCAGHSAITDDHNWLEGGGCGIAASGDPNLGLLQDNGGPTRTHALLAGSGAVDAGSNTTSLSTDQRGVARPQGVGYDIGAYEKEAPRLSIAKTVTPWTDAACHGTVTYTVVLSNAGAVSDAAVLLTDTLPAEVTFGSWVVSPTNTIRDGNAITWTGAIASGAGVTFAYTAIHSGDCVDVVPNTAWFSGTMQTGSAQAVFITAEAHRVFLPLVIRNVPHFAATLTVTKAADTDDGVCNGDCSLREALFVAADGDTITFAGDYVIYLNSTLSISKTLTVDGSGHTVVVSGDTGGDGWANVRVFTIEASGVVTLSRLSVVNGAGESFGGGIDNAGTLLVTRCTLSGNTAYGEMGGGSGGGIHNSGTLTVQDSTLSGNTADYGGGIYNYQGTVTVQNSTLSGNTVSLYGGSIYNSYGTLTVQSSTLSGNTAYYGGGIYNDGTLLVTHSTLSGNTAYGEMGGGIHNSGALTVTDSTLSGNKAINGHGGGIYNYQGTVTVQNSTLSGNTASGSCGLYCLPSGGGINNYQGTLTVQNSTLFGNTADSKGGGGIRNSGTLHLRNTIVAHSTGDDCGGNAASTDDHNWLETAGCGIAASGDPALGPLQDNGGPTWTHVLLDGSGAIDAGNDATCLATDQRGVARPQDGDGDGSAVCDIGAYEESEK